MAYRSDVAYIIAGKNDDIVRFLVECRMTHPEVRQAIEECTVGKLDDTAMYIGFSAYSVKWHSDYPDVACHETLYDLAYDRAEVFDGLKCTIGESDDDVSTDNFGEGAFDLWSKLSISRELCIDFQTGKEYDIREKLKEVLCSSTPSLP